MDVWSDGPGIWYLLVKRWWLSDGSIRDLDGISDIDMPACYGSTDLTPIGNVMLSGIHVPIRIGQTNVMAGDLVVGDREGVYFIPPQFVMRSFREQHNDRTHDSLAFNFATLRRPSMMIPSEEAYP